MPPRLSLVSRDEMPHPAVGCRAINGNAVLAFECLVLTACRSGDVRGATWDEIDLENVVWAIPGERMKVHRAHWVPLSSGARAVLIQSKELTDHSNLVFPSVTGRPLSDRPRSMSA